MGRHLLFDAFASGGMATVHFGRMVGPAGFGRTVAMKRLHAQFASSHEFVRMLLDEARLTGRIRHPNVVPTLDVVLQDREVFLVMEYVHGESFARLLMGRKAPPAPEIVVALVTQALLGLHAAHETRDERGAPLGIIHRDATPHNVMVDSQGLARIIDFGVAKAQGVIHTTGEGRFKGKVSYMAPEQLQDGICDRRADVFAASVMLWEGITRKHLFTRDSPGATITAVLKGEVRKVSEIQPNLPCGLDDVILRGLAPDPDERFTTALEMAEALSSVLTPASQLEVAHWVQEVAGEELEARHRLLEDIERDLYSDVENIRQSVDRALREGALAASSVPSEYRGPPEQGSLVGASEMPTVELPRDIGSSPLGRCPSFDRDVSSAASTVGPRSRRSTWAGWRWATLGFIAAGVMIALWVVPRPKAVPKLMAGLVPLRLTSHEPLWDVTADPAADTNLAPENAPAESRPVPAEQPLRVEPKPARRGPCSPPWTIDDKGRKRFKLDCF